VIEFEDAQRMVIAACGPLGVETVRLEEAVGRVVAETLRACADLVPFARSAMDGFAVRAADVARGGVLPVGKRVYAQRSASLTHEPHTATEIATGAAIPHGADAVVPVEDVARENGAIHLHAEVAAGENVFPPGEDARTGDELIGSGRRISSADAGLLASAGCSRVCVYARPRVAIVSTGDEIVEPAATPAHGQIRNSNAIVLDTTLAAWGCEILSWAHSPDEAEALRAILEVALDRCDLLVTTGGASVGPRDFVKSLLRELGCAFAFDSVALRPAKPTAFATRGVTRVAVLPGNPSSAFVGLHEIVRPAALTLAGQTGDVRLPRVPATLGGANVHGKAERTYACYAALRLGTDGLVATPLANQCSALTRTASDAGGLIVVPRGRREYVPGDAVDVDVIDWSAVWSGAR
jgi:molybdopterin molybdotransferase